MNLKWQFVLRTQFHQPPHDEVLEFFSVFGRKFATRTTECFCCALLWHIGELKCAFIGEGRLQTGRSGRLCLLKKPVDYHQIIVERLYLEPILGCKTIWV